MSSWRNIFYVGFNLVLKLYYKTDFYTRIKINLNFHFGLVLLFLFMFLFLFFFSKAAHKKISFFMNSRALLLDTTKLHYMTKEPVFYFYFIFFFFFIFFFLLNQIDTKKKIFFFLEHYLNS